MSKVTAWLVLRDTERKGIVATQVRQNRPPLAEDEVAVKLSLDVDRRIFDAPVTVTATIAADDVVRPEIRAEVGSGNE
ncbi:hypothetical protein F8O07_06860 [Pseudoclavibacter sp. CFCC 13796]|uniref:hypothetical protein n=1 Tax=Pseudoclavibacter sp. CFCC 13796 TaxID=2615179 RepID=UPI0013016A1C|nr:hypothetical protein [Pseudoclavibacter sp. CFCC 13796]KAB1661619.1 hypothetical protein F8O07_06860 [Pseudoclavibacter sp. CFCC 13796]